MERCTGTPPPPADQPPRRSAPRPAGSALGGSPTTRGGSDTSLENNNVYGLEPKVYVEGSPVAEGEARRPRRGRRAEAGLGGLPGDVLGRWSRREGQLAGAWGLGCFAAVLTRPRGLACSGERGRQHQRSHGGHPHRDHPCGAGRAGWRLGHLLLLLHLT